MRRSNMGIASWVILALLASVSPALANAITSTTPTLACAGSTLVVDGIDLNSDSYVVMFSVTFTPPSGPATTVSGSVPAIPNDAAGDFTVTITLPPAPSGASTVTGTVELFDLTTNFSFQGPVDLGQIGTLDCPAPAGGCPATIGFWKNKKKHPFPTSVQSSGLTIGGVTYSAADLYLILSATGGNAVAILGKQLVGALLNLAAGAAHNITADAAISDAESLLMTNSLNLLTSVVAPGSMLGSKLVADAAVLDGYNSSNFNTCSEGSGLTTGP
jgi:hypothetical protein